jgi:hypothetical protein
VSQCSTLARFTTTTGTRAPASLRSPMAKCRFSISSATRSSSANGTTCASFAALFAGASLSVASASDAGTITTTRRPALIAVACASSPDTAFTMTWPSPLHTSHCGAAPSRR